MHDLEEGEGQAGVELGDLGLALAQLPGGHRRRERGLGLGLGLLLLLGHLCTGGTKMLHGRTSCKQANFFYQDAHGKVCGGGGGGSWGR